MPPNRTLYRRGGPIAVEGMRQREYSTQPVEGAIKRFNPGGRKEEKERDSGREGTKQDQGFWRFWQSEDENVKKQWETGGILFREYCFGEENSLSSAVNSVSSATNSVSSCLHTNNRLRGTH